MFLYVCVYMVRATVFVYILYFSQFNERSKEYDTHARARRNEILLLIGARDRLSPNEYYIRRTAERVSNCGGSSRRGSRCMKYY